MPQVPPGRGGTRLANDGLPGSRTQVPASALRRRHRAGWRDPHAAERHCKRPLGPGIRVRRSAGGRQDDHGAHPRAGSSTARAVPPPIPAARASRASRSPTGATSTSSRSTRPRTPRSRTCAKVIIAGLAMAPVRDRYKVFIIDEFHQLSSHSFNALLKSIEEPPAARRVSLMATHRAAEDPRDHPVPLAGVRAAHHRHAGHLRAAPDHRRPGADRDRRGRRGAHRARGRRQPARCVERARSGDCVRGRGGSPPRRCPRCSA